MRRSISRLLILLFLAANGLPQIPAERIKTGDGDPFDIGFARSFSASRPGVTVSASQPTVGRESKKILGDLSEAIQLVRENYADGDRVDLNSLTKNAITGALQTLDPHSSYFDSVEYGEFLDEQQSEYSGIGATIGGYWLNGEFNTYIKSTVPGSPAAAARLVFGDQIVRVDDQTVTGKSADEVTEAVRGTAGTRVRLTIKRAASGRLETVDIRRRLVPQPSIKDTFVLPGGIGYVAMTEGFNYSTADELAAALKQLHRQPLKGLILDIRENPGGILEQAVRVAERFLPAGSVIVSQRGRSKIDNRVWTSTNRSPETLPLVLLVNENSASASEILAGALQDHDRALIVGEKTFGKGLVQSLFDGPAGTGLTLTTARYYTPSGRSIQRDYSDGNLYDYYFHRSPASAEIRSIAKTSSNRSVFGGDGIDPDEASPAVRYTRAEQEIDRLAFFFIIDLINNRLSKNYLDDLKYIKTSDAPGVENITNSRLMFGFREFAGRERAVAINDETMDSERHFMAERLLYNLTLAMNGDRLASRIDIADDAAVKKAMSQLPRARDLAALAMRQK
jgi:carboxyl-terminal processing protease